MGGRWRLPEHGFRVRTAHLMEAIGCRALRHCVPHKVVQSSSRVWESIPRNFTGLARGALLPPKFTFFTLPLLLRLPFFSSSCLKSQEPYRVNSSLLLTGKCCQNEKLGCVKYVFIQRLYSSNIGIMNGNVIM